MERQRYPYQEFEDIFSDEEIEMLKPILEKRDEEIDRKKRNHQSPRIILRDDKKVELVRVLTNWVEEIIKAYRTFINKKEEEWVSWNRLSKELKINIHSLQSYYNDGLKYKKPRDKTLINLKRVKVYLRTKHNFLFCEKIEQNVKKHYTI